MSEAYSPEQLSAPIEGADPCGQPFPPEKEQQFLELEQRFSPKNPDYEKLPWESIEMECRTLLEGRRDLKLGLFLALARLRTKGIAGWTDGLKLLTSWVRHDGIWTGIPPASLAGRVNLLRELAAEYAAESDLRFVRALYHLPLDGSDSQSPATLKNFNDGNRDQVVRLIAAGNVGFRQDLARNIAAGRAAFKDLCDALVARIGADDAKNRGRISAMQFAIIGVPLGTKPPEEGKPLLTAGLLNRMERLVRGETVEEEKGGEQDGGSRDEGGGGKPAASINSRPEALQRLGAIQLYYQHRERSSPVPLLVAQARALVDQDLRDIVKNLFGPEELKKLSTFSELPPSTPLASPPASDKPAPPIENAKVVRAELDALANYFSTTEPSSPISIILGRARDLVEARFDFVVGEFLGKEALARFNAMLGLKSGNSTKP